MFIPINFVSASISFTPNIVGPPTLDNNNNNNYFVIMIAITIIQINKGRQQI